MRTKAVNLNEVIAALRAIRQILDRLESRLGDLTQEDIDPYGRRREILQTIYWHQNSMSRQELLPILNRHGTDYRWIAQQVKKGYLIVLPTPHAEPRYAVTAKAVRELQLAHEESPEDLGEVTVLAKLSEASFAEDWDSKEDAVYDNL